MSGEHDYDTPCYISARSADVILSDVRPTSLAPDALSAVNALLDELLHAVLAAARALTTTQLRAGLHKVLPTTLGKEAVLEAELELRAYWERTGAAPGSGSSHPPAEDGAFDLKWAFELLRLKCEAYSTLSDTDENSDAETRLFQHMSAEGISPPKQTLLAPASLYLTAIIESVCEHVVSNVGRVIARDSSRTVANVQDLFVALCEDSSIYGLFKNMAVYGQIEAFSKMPRSRRSVSIARENDAASLPVSGTFRRNGSIHQSRTRLSSESVNNAPIPATNSSRPSLDKDRPRAAKMLYNKVSQDFVTNGSDPGHRKVDSFASANTKQSLASRSDRSPISPTFSEDTRSQEFDDMMRSGSTMKVSLTPDRLRTMEMLNKEKARANGRQKAPLKTENSNGVDTSASHSFPEQAARTNGPFPTVRRVGSVIGSEEERLTQKPPPTSRPRQLSAATTSSYIAPSFSRVRATSITTESSAPPPNMPLNKFTSPESNPVFSELRSSTGSMPRRRAPPHELDLNTRSPRGRTIPRSRESLNLEDLMGGSDDEGMGELKSMSRQRDRQRGFSSNTKELIAFLAEGPPELASSENLLSPLSPTTPKKSGRLQKMMSKITLASDTAKPRKMTVGSVDGSSKSMTNLSPLANRPVPPRYPTSAPPTKTTSERGSADKVVTYPRQRAQSSVHNSTPAWNGTPAPSPPTTTAETAARSARPLPVNAQSAQENATSSSSSAALLSPPASSMTIPTRGDVTPKPAMQSLSPPSTSTPMLLRHVTPKTITPPLPQKAAPPASEAPSLAPSIIEHALDMRTMLEHATSAAECRVLVDMFLARSKLALDMASPRSSNVPLSPRDSGVDGLEKAVVELFLGDDESDAQRDVSLDNHRERLSEDSHGARRVVRPVSLVGKSVDSR